MTAFPSTDPAALLDDMDFVRRLARRLCADPDDADDLAQDAMTRAVRRTTDDAGFRRHGWLAAVVGNIARNRYRTDVRRRARERAWVQLHAAADAVPSAADVAEREELRGRVVEAVLALPDPYRSTLLLRFYEGHGTARCAELLGVSASTIRTRQQRGLEMLRVRLDAEHGGDRSAWIAVLSTFARPGATTIPAVDATAVSGSRIVSHRLLAIALLGIVAAGVVWLANPTAPVAIPSLATVRGTTPEESQGARTSDTSEPGRPSPDAERTAVASSDTEPAWTATGRLIGGIDVPMAGAEVRVFAVIEGVPATRRDPIATAVTDAGGRFEVSLDALKSWSRMRLAAACLEVQSRSDGFALETREVAENALHRIDFGDVVDLGDLQHNRAHRSVGRVVDPTGRAIPGAAVRAYTADEVLEKTASTNGGWFEIEADLSVSAATSGEVLRLVAWHPRLGLSHPVAVPARASGRLPDIVLGSPAQTVEAGRLVGRVAFTDGSPVAHAGFEIVPVAVSEDGSVSVVDTAFDTIGGFAAPDDLDLFDDIDWIARAAEARTDARGNFRIAGLPPGVWAIAIDGYELHAENAHSDTAWGRIVHVRPRRETECSLVVAGRQLGIHIVDEDGRELPQARFTLHSWTGEAAADAARTWTASGPTPDLLATAAQSVVYEIFDNRFLPVEAGFHVVEAAWQGAGPVCAAATVGPDACRADVEIVLVPRATRREATGGLVIDLRGVEPLDDPVIERWYSSVRVRAAHAPRGMSFALGDEPVGPVKAGAYPPDRYRLPPDGRFDDLPIGRHVVEVLPMVTVLEGGWYGPRPYAAEFREVEIQRGRTTTLRIDARRGVPVRIAFDPVPVPSNERLFVSARARVEGPDGRSFDVRLVDHERHDSRISLPAARRRLWSLDSFVPGRYRLHLTLRCSRSTWIPKTAKQRGRWGLGRLLPEDRLLLEVDLDGSDVPVRIPH